MTVFDALASTGLDVRDCRVPGYRGRGIDVRGTLWHHTASPAGSGDLPSLGVCQRGRPDLPGPLCQVLIGRAGTVAVITDGRANHAGEGSWPGISDGNGQLVGVELENDGVGEPFTAGQLEVARRVGRALRRRFGHALDIGHKEWAPRRKIDPAFDMGAFRASLDAPPVAASIDYGGIDMDKVHTKLVEVRLDGGGNGWRDVPFGQPVARIIGIAPNGPFPPENGYPRAPRVSAQMRGGVVIVTVTDGPANGSIHVWVSAA